MNKISVSLSGLAALSTLALGNAAWAQDIVLGASVQLTGPVANTGRYYREAYQVEIDKSDAAGASLDQSPYTRDKHQQWKVARTNDGFSRITSAASGKVVDLWYCKPENGTKIDQFKWLDNACQRWKIEKPKDTMSGTWM